MREEWNFDKRLIYLARIMNEVFCLLVNDRVIAYARVTAEIIISYLTIGLLHNPVTWYGINYAGTEVTDWGFQNKRTRTSQARLSFILKVPLCNLRPSIINSVPYDRIVQRAYCSRRALCISETASTPGNQLINPTKFKSNTFD